MGLSATTIWMVEQLGVAMMPVWAVRWSALTSGTTRGTPGSWRNMLDLSITVAPAATACGTNSLLTEPPAAKKTRSTPSNEPGASSRTSTSEPPKGSRRPAERALARSRSSPTGNDALLEDRAHRAADDAGRAGDGDRVLAGGHQQLPLSAGS